MNAWKTQPQDDIDAYPNNDAAGNAFSAGALGQNSSQESSQDRAVKRRAEYIERLDNRIGNISYQEGKSGNEDPPNDRR